MSGRHSRRTALTRLGLWAGASPLLDSQQPGPGLQAETPGRIAPREDLVNVFEMESMAERSLRNDLYAAIAGGDRQGFERLIFRPRRFFNVEHLDLTVDLFGEKMFTPVLIGPAADQKRFHPDGELAVMRAASATQATVVVSERASQPLDKIAGIAAEAKIPFWYQVYAADPMTPALDRMQQAAAAGCRVLCVTISPPVNWPALDAVHRKAGVPVVLKGIMTPGDARLAGDKGFQGIVVSNQGALAAEGAPSPIEVLPSIVDAVSGKIPVLIDGGFRRGSDIVKALALGARAVLVTRPVLWGLAAYGSDGVETVIRMLQSETARTIGLCGKTNLSGLDRSLVRISKH